MGNYVSNSKVVMIEMKYSEKLMNNLNQSIALLIIIKPRLKHCSYHHD